MNITLVIILCANCFIAGMQYQEYKKNGGGQCVRFKQKFTQGCLDIFVRLLNGIKGNRQSLK